ncbi:M56 family metallopeptidase [Dyadobacter sandarakinus]|uniref:M48 family metalloprotease n=1 Tax=Dyadobacter sandarakinus TaxID=2747268 RepID=A0ABX7ICS8_9BACT|nr:M56 family metallopeptidase [Dyadobacter sandarakinus]QRR02928.1 M48 family metalloprotease [Dyadobacter sandarakinus]
MKATLNLFNDATLAAFGWTLVHSLWQGAILALIACAAFYFFKHRTAQTRYLTGVLLLAAQLTASVITFLYYQSKTVTISGLKPAVLQQPAVALSQLELSMAFKMQLWLTLHLHELVICWIIGAGLLLLRFMGGWIFTERLRTRAHVVADREWRTRFGVIAARMNIKQSVDFKESNRVTAPVVIGTFSPVVLVPFGFLTGFPPAQLEAILAHELAHIQRNDYLVNVLQSLVEVIFFFHPGIWWLSERIRAEREHCCDDIALRVCGDKMSLAYALLKVADWQTTTGMAMAFASRKPLLLNRIHRLLGLSAKSQRFAPSLSATILTVAIATMVSAYAFAQQTDKPVPKKTAKHHTAARKSKAAHQNVDPAIEIEEPEMNIQIEETENMELMIDPGMENDSINKKIAEINQKMQTMEAEMRPYQSRMDELNLEMEKQRFEMERAQRQLEQIEWKKERIMDVRSGLMEQRSEILDHAQEQEVSKDKETEVEKQVAELEQKIKAQEQAVTDLNTQIAAAQKAVSTAEEPIQKSEAELQEISAKLDELGRNAGLESLGLARVGVPAPRPPKPPRAARIHGAPAPPPPPAKVVRPKSPPTPPLAPARK